MAGAKSVIREYVEALVIAAILSAFIITFVAQSYLVQGSSMEPTLSNGQRLLVNKFIYRFTEPVYGDIIVFKYPANPSTKFVKRVIGAPGDTIEIKNGRVYLNDDPLDEDYIATTTTGRYEKRTIPEDHLFVLGDNRNNSDDSRYPGVGFVPYENVVGKVFLRYWPLPDISIVRFEAE